MPRGGLAAKALELPFQIASRVSEVLNAARIEFYIENTLWSFPAEHMKMKRDHRIPLTENFKSIL
ncbi:MAG: hypothetical protein AAF478_10535 [Pseudomonadota bacterium]